MSSNKPNNAVVKKVNCPKPAPGSSSSSKTVARKPPMDMNRVNREVRQMIDGSTVRPIKPANQYDVISMARAMNRDNFAERVQEIFEPERDGALLAIQTGIYISWRCPDQQHDCQRIGMNGRCFCGHILADHKKWDGHSLTTPCGLCKCRGFAWVPSRPEEVGEFWLRRRPDFDETSYRAKCKCKHTHEQHEPNGDRRCTVRGCAKCFHFDSAFLCAACDRHWQVHDTVFENESMRLKEGRAVGQDYLPFAEAPGLKRIVMGGEDRGFDTLDEAIADNYGPHQGLPFAQKPSIGPPRRAPALPPPPITKGHRGGNDDAFPMPK